MDKSELQRRHFAVLRQKYQVDQYKNSESDRFLYLILRKAELSIEINNLEYQ
jgi:hypothetical protein